MITARVFAGKHYAVYGLALVAVMLALPGGVVPAVVRAFARMQL